jgi:PIN domain nuclease of toxin-antitoxin system
MDCLLDTCTFLWLIAGDPRLSTPSAQVIADPVNRCFLSAASAWEIAAKFVAGKLPLPRSPDVLIPLDRSLHRLDPLDLVEPDALRLATLPLLHKDPFDRMLVCQALNHRLIILTPDADIRKYAVPTFW